MVTCKETKCLKRVNLDADGYCQIHRVEAINADEVINKCGKCENNVPDDSNTKALCCDADDCKVWYHLECTKISVPMYELINNASKEDLMGSAGCVLNAEKMTL